MEGGQDEQGVIERDRKRAVAGGAESRGQKAESREQRAESRG